MTDPSRPDIRPPAAIDAAWMTALLRSAGVDAEVTGVSMKPVGTGQIGDSFRFTLNYARRGDDAPASLVGKFPAAGEDSRNAGAALGNYLREVRFYQELAPTALISTPRCYFTDVDEVTSAFVLIMEDLAPAEQGDQLKGVSLDQARLVLVEAAKLHASHWGDGRLDALPWVCNTTAAPPSMLDDEKVGKLWRGFKDRYAARLEPDWIAAGDWYAPRYEAIRSRYDGPRCLVHDDFRPDNMMFASARGGRPVTVLDWQSIGYAAGANDVAYFLAGALSPEERRAAEPELLSVYHETLTGLGVSGYSLEAFTRHYRQGGHKMLLTAFAAAMMVTPTPRGDEMFLRMLSSGAAHMLDHDEDLRAALGL
jgi:hypothetical protein